MPRPKPRALAESEVQAAVSEMIDFYKAQDASIEDVREVVEGRNTVAIDDAYLTTGYRHRDPTATDHVLTTGAMFTVNRPKLQLTFESRSLATEKLKTRLEPALETLILDDAGLKGETYTRVGASLSQDGGAWSSLIADLDAWKGPGNRYSIKRNAKNNDGTPAYADDDGYPTAQGSKSGEEKYISATDKAKRRSRCILQWRYRDPKTVYPVWLGEDELGAVFVVTEHPKWTTLSEYGMTLDREGNIVDVAVGQPMAENTRANVGEKIKKIEHWTASTVCYYLSSGTSTRRVDEITHNYGFVPFAWSYGWRLPHWSNIKVGWGAAAVMLQSVKYLSYLKTLEANLAAAAVAPAYKRIVPVGGDIVRDRQHNAVFYTELRPNQVLNLQPGEDVVPIQQAAPNQYIREQIVGEEQKIVQLRGPVAEGNLNDAQNGFAIESVKSDRSVKNSPFTNGLQGHLEQVTSLAIRLLRGKIKESVWVRPSGEDGGTWMSISPADLEDEPAVRWDVSPEQAAGAIVEARLWHERLQAGTAGPDQAITALGDNPQDVYEDQMRAKIRQDPAVYNLALAETFAEYARGDLLQRMQAAQQSVATGQVPPQPGSAPGGMGAGGMMGDVGAQTMSPNGQGATPQSSQAAGIGGLSYGVPAHVGIPGRAAVAQVQDIGR